MDETSMGDNKKHYINTVRLEVFFKFEFKGKPDSKNSGCIGTLGKQIKN